MISGITLLLHTLGPNNASAGTKTLLWTLPSMVDGLGVTTSYTGSVTGAEATIGYALTYTGVEGLSVKLWCW